MKVRFVNWPIYSERKNFNQNFGFKTILQIQIKFE